MKLQVNNSGAWKHVVNFASKHLVDAQLAAGNLGLMGALCDYHITLRVLDDNDLVVSHWTLERGWVDVPRHAQRRAA